MHRCIAACFGILVAAGPVRAADPAPSSKLTPFEASYAWSWSGATIAVSNVKLAHQDGDVWIYSSSSEPRGLGHLYPMRPKLRSTLRVTDRGVEPLTFHAEDSGSRDSDVTFDWAAGHASGVYEGTQVDMPISPGVQDDLSVQIELMVDLLHGRTPDHVSEINKNSVRDYRYLREGEATLATPLGQIATVIYSSQHPGSPRITRFWCAPSMGFLPMKVEQKLHDEKKQTDKVEWTLDILSTRRD